MTPGAPLVELLNYESASARFGLCGGKPVVSVHRLRRAVARRELRCVRVGHRTVLFRPVDLDRWAERLSLEASV
jgi:hypothetical protein